MSIRSYVKIVLACSLLGAVVIILLSSNEVAEHDRILGVAITDGATGFDEAFLTAKEAGSTFVEIPVHWNETEITPGVFQNEWLSIANAFYPSEGMSLGLSLNPIDTNNLTTPEFLRTKKFSDREMITSFKQFVTYVASQVPDATITYIAVGNEIDGFLASESDWKEYTFFYEAVLPHVKETFPDAVIGTKITFAGLTAKRVREAVAINTHSTGILTTYYPFQEDTFIVKPPHHVHTDFETLVQTYPNTPIYIAEIGYPSSELNNSSESLQAAFINESFSAWNNNQPHIKLLNFVWLHDISPEQVSFYSSYYQMTDPAFLSYISTLGLRTFDGADKAALTTLKREARKAHLK